MLWSFVWKPLGNRRNGRRERLNEVCSRVKESHRKVNSGCWRHPAFSWRRMRVVTDISENWVEECGKFKTGEEKEHGVFDEKRGGRSDVPPRRLERILTFLSGGWKEAQLWLMLLNCLEEVRRRVTFLGNWHTAHCSLYSLMICCM